MIRYPFVLLDADNTLYDFDAAEHKALCKVLSERGYTPDEATVDLYLEINTALWEAFARGEVEQEFLLVERFRRFVQRMGGNHDAVQFNADYLQALSSNADLIPGAVEFCRHLAGMGCELAIVTNGAAVAQHADAVKLGEPDVHQHHVGQKACQLLQSFFAVGCLLKMVIAHAGKSLAKGTAAGGVFIRNQNFGCVFHSKISSKSNFPP